MLIDINDCKNSVERHSKGLYLRTHFKSFDLFDHNQSEWMSFHHEWPEMQGSAGERYKFLLNMFKTNTYIQEYGSCDSIEQFQNHELHRIIESSPHLFVVVFQYLTKKEDSGYRWHKNGAYIGLRNQKFEHLGDEDEIDEIYQFHVFRKK